MRILLVDDSKTMRNIWKKVVATLGEVQTAEAENGEEALKVIDNTPEGFDLMLLDWNMPVMDGLTLLKKIRQTDFITKIIMVTTEAERTRVVEAIRAGANNYVIKPFTPEMLTQKITEVMHKASI